MDVTLVSKEHPSRAYQPISLTGGVPHQLTGVDLAPYLDPANLNLSGINPNEFSRSRRLPEGFYRVEVEAVEYRRGVTVSNKGLAIANMALNQPPKWVMPWTLPRENTLLRATEPQNIFFSWMPMHSATSSTAGTIEYVFTLVEVYPENRNPADALRSANNAPLSFTTTTPNMNFFYGPSEYIFN